MNLSIICPLYNEKDNLAVLADKIKKSLTGHNVSAEIIFIDDGSTDDSSSVLKSLAAKNKNIKVLIFKKNFGQTAALSAGIKFSSGDIIIPMDSDLQNDPEDIWALIQKLEEGYDLVSGWRKNRQDGLLTRRIPSWAANFIISYITKVKLHDYGCTLKAYRRNILENVNLYGEMHRFIPIFAKQGGAKIAEIEVRHHPRKFGQSKYNITRIARVLLDLLTVKFLNDYSTRPMHFFGGVGIISFALGGICFIAALYLKFMGYATLIQTPLPLFGVFLSIAGLQLILMGLLAEMIMRNYYESQNKPTFIIREKINF